MSRALSDLVVPHKTMLLSLVEVSANEKVDFCAASDNDKDYLIELAVLCLKEVVLNCKGMSI